MRTAKTLIRLGGCPGWSESSLGSHSFCWFCHFAAYIIMVSTISVIPKMKSQIWCHEYVCLSLLTKNFKPFLQLSFLSAQLTIHSRWKCNDQEPIQSNSTSCPRQNTRDGIKNKTAQAESQEDSPQQTATRSFLDKANETSKTSR